MFPWQHIFELALMRNRPIQLSNDVTVTLFLNQSSQNFAMCLEMILSITVQNFSGIQFFILPLVTHSLGKGHFLPGGESS